MGGEGKRGKEEKEETKEGRKEWKVYLGITNIYFRRNTLVCSQADVRLT